MGRLLYEKWPALIGIAGDHKAGAIRSRKGLGFVLDAGAFNGHPLFMKSWEQALQRGSLLPESGRLILCSFEQLECAFLTG